MSFTLTDPLQASLFPSETPSRRGYSTHLVLSPAPVCDITHSFASTRFGWACFAENPDGLCALAFGDDKIGAASHVLRRFPVMAPAHALGPNSEKALAILEDPFLELQVRVVVNGTAFQKNVWRLLGDYGVGQQTTYGQLAGRLSLPKGARAVGTALGANPVAFFIPCHRVLNANGASGHFRWGAARKRAMLDWERSLLLPGD